MDSLLQLEIDIDRVTFPGSQTSWERVDACYAFEGFRDGSVHHRIPTAFDNLRTGNGAVLENLDLYRANEGFVLLENGCWLLPLAEKAVVYEFMIPSKLARCAPCISLARSAGGRAFAVATCARFCIGLGGGFGAFSGGGGCFG